MNILLLLAGGIGSRMNMGKIPKQYLIYNDRAIIMYSLLTFNKHEKIDKIIIVANSEWHKIIKEWMRKEKISKFMGFAEPGENRQLSIKNGLQIAAKIAGYNDTVIIHDAARPLVSTQLITNCLNMIGRYDGVMPVIPAKDTYYLTSEDGCADKLLPRSRLVAGQAPEAFRFGQYLEAHNSVSYEEMLKINGSTEIAVKAGMKIITIPGEERNFKITTQDDLKLLSTYIDIEETI